MKRILIALFAVALLSGVPLLAQYEEDPAANELQENELQEQEMEVETELQTGEEVETEIETDVDTDLDADLEADLDADVDDDSFDDDELPATGSALPLAGLIGLASLAGAAVLRFRS